MVICRKENSYCINRLRIILILRKAMSSEILSETILAMLQLGEFEFADQLQKSLPPEQAKDPLLTQCIQSIRSDVVITERRNQYQLSNEQDQSVYERRSGDGF